MHITPNTYSSPFALKFAARGKESKERGEQAQKEPAAALENVTDLLADQIIRDALADDAAKKNRGN